jgi:hypothetical protein
MEARKIAGDVITVHSCPTCGTGHESKTDAKKCCPLEIEKHFECGSCGDIFDSKADAKNCCQIWQCTWCGEEFDIKVDANECCKD